MRVHAAQSAGDHFATGDPDMGLQGVTRRSTTARQRRVNVQRGAHRAQGIVVMGPRRTKECHHRIADMFVYCTSIAHNDTVHLGREAGDQLPDFLWIERS